MFEYKYTKTDVNIHEIIKVDSPDSLARLSGSPVVDINSDVVGLISTGWKDEKSGRVLVAVSRINKILSFLSNW